MASRIALFGIFSFLQGFGMVLNRGWGNGFVRGFFEIPYSFAYWFVPLTCGLLAYFSAYYVLCKKQIQNPMLAGILVATLGFLAYALIHSVVVGFFVIFDPESSFLSAIVFSIVMFFAIIMFGGISFLPISVALSVLASLLGSWAFPVQTEKHNVHFSVWFARALLVVVLLPSILAAFSFGVELFPSEKNRLEIKHRQSASLSQEVR